MQVKEWLLGLEKYAEPLSAFIKTITGAEYEVGVVDVDTKDVEGTSAIFADDNIIYRAIESQFHTEVIIGYPTESFNPLVANLTDSKELSEEEINDLIHRINDKLFEQVSSSLRSAQIDVNIDEFETIPVKEVQKSLNLPQYLIAKLSVKSDETEFNLSIAIGEPNKKAVDQVITEWAGSNPFETAEIVDQNIKLFGDVTIKVTKQAYDEESKVNVRGKSVQFEPFDKANNIDNDREVTNIDMLKDVEMAVSVELGSRDMPLGKILQLVKGSVIELERMAGEPVDILVNGHTIATGDVVVIEDYFGVRITHLNEEHLNFNRVR